MTLLAGCGFQLRGDPAVGIKTMSVSQVGASQVAAEIRRTLSTGPTRVIPIPGEAEAHLRILGEAREKSVFTLTGAGRVYEFQLRLVVRLPAHRAGARRSRSSRRWTSRRGD
jgi:LPS-assembly lipoprotein